MSAKRGLLVRWLKTREVAEEFRDAFSRWTETETELATLYRSRYPLSEKAKTAVRDLYLRGEALCCAVGRENLEKAKLDPCWAEWINEQAYERIGCSEAWKPGERYHEQGKEKLEAILRGEER